MKINKVHDMFDDERKDVELSIKVISSRLKLVTKWHLLEIKMIRDQ